MATLQLTDAQVVELVRQLSPDQKRAAILALAADAAAHRDQRMEKAEAQLRRICAERGLDWEKLTADERESFIDDLVHEDRACGT